MMKISKILTTAAALLLTGAVSAQNQEMDKFVDGLMSRMTLHEKIGQLNLQVAGDITTGQAQDSEVSGKIKAGEIGGVFNLKGVDKIKALQKLAVEKSRLGIPLLVGMDVIHGYETIFPIPFALSCSWDLNAIERAAQIAAKEATADGINWVFSPMVDICIDARWGRISEGNGEDPYLGSRIAEAMIRGYQGDYSSNANVMACLKHFALYGAVEAGRDYNTVDMSRLRMYNQYLEPYRAAVKAGTGSVMTSFNLVDYVPATANKWLLEDVLRTSGGFFALNGGGLGEDIGNVYYFAPDALAWEGLEVGYSAFVEWALCGDLALFYQTVRWPNWREEVRTLGGEQVYAFFPFLWTEPKLSVNERKRTVTPIEEQWRLAQELAESIPKS